MESEQHTSIFYAGVLTLDLWKNIRSLEKVF